MSSDRSSRYSLLRSPQPVTSNKPSTNNQNTLNFHGFQIPNSRGVYTIRLHLHSKKRPINKHNMMNKWSPTSWSPLIQKTLYVYIYINLVFFPNGVASSGRPPYLDWFQFSRVSISQIPNCCWHQNRDSPNPSGKKPKPWMFDRFSFSWSRLLTLYYRWWFRNPKQPSGMFFETLDK